ncbi:MAG: valine--tRNA ligase [Candidatus Omnitrophota bacterium]|nr:valine--tRNA ligase [Candidatus Omnitrophota bacterium]MDZ4242820.1 valine--tRNA ligase [Candidatus Omnitrophota bacterium]
MNDLSTRFSFKDVEAKWRRHWEDNGIFHAEPRDGKKPYSIVIPPPNVTGILHMGHALNNTLQDILIRYKRMQGFEACWMPGTDHAGIATQNVVEKQLAKEGKTRHDIGREEMLTRLWDWKKQYGDTIINQLKQLGASCDWPRTRFTMDDDYSGAVRHVFIALYKKGLVYRGQYIINWCPRCQTALSDEEAEHKNVNGSLYHIRYPFKDDLQKFVIVATTRPETMLGDTAVAVHPNDPRYKKLIGKTLVLPLLNREINIIADDFVNPEFGTGVVKVTPAHDPNDFQMGQRHKLEFINIMHPDARLNENAGPFKDMDRFKARAKVLEALKEANFLEKMDQHAHAVGHCYRCHTVVEPYLSKQWFVKMKPLAQPALKAVKDGKIKFYPERWTKVYTNWMEEIRDWCISRQIWWGHRIPVWYCDGEKKCSEPIVADQAPAKCPHCGSLQLKQDEDVLDTWFSSWLWPFATFGWPEGSQKSDVRSQQKKDLEYFYPTNSLFTASEIIFFWVARMIMAGIEFMGDIPFSDVYIHGTVRDAQGRKMSKSLGNAIDPLEIIGEYGADALRFSLIVNSGQDLYISKEKFEVGRNFANKIWNASRLVLMNVSLPEGERNIDLENDASVRTSDLPTRWIVSKFYSTLAEVDRAIDNYRFSEAENLIYDFFWKNFCDWYLEMIKGRFSDPAVQKITFAILEKSVRMMHPFLPFVTEEIWAHLGISKDCLAVQPWPEAKPGLIDSPTEDSMQTIIDLVSGIRNLKVQWNIKPQQVLDCHFAAGAKAHQRLFDQTKEILQNLGRINPVVSPDNLAGLKNAATGITGGIKFALPLGDVIDVEKEKRRILEQIAQFKKDSAGLSGRLANQSFLAKAPHDVVKKEQERLAALTGKIQELDGVIRNLSH